LRRQVSTSVDSYFRFDVESDPLLGYVNSSFSPYTLGSGTFFLAARRA
jgi:hypothetical protein